MTVGDLLLKLGSAFTLFRGAGEVWAPVFRARLAGHEGAALQQAFLATLAGFEPSARQPFPLPADFERNLPARRVAPRGRGDSGKLDFAARARRAETLLAEWRRAQGERAAGGVAELAAALAGIAGPLANRAAWRADPPPLRLSAAELGLARQRALSQQRRREQGSLPRDSEAWWSQIAAIAERWNLATCHEEWSGLLQQQQQQQQERA